MSNSFTSTNSYPLDNLTLSLSHDGQHILVIQDSTQVDSYELTQNPAIRIVQDGGTAFLEVGTITWNEPIPLGNKLNLSDFRTVFGLLDKANMVYLAGGFGITVIDAVDPIDIRILKFPLKDNFLEFQYVNSSILFMYSKEN